MTDDRLIGDGLEWTGVLVAYGKAWAREDDASVNANGNALLADHRARTERIAALEAELAALREIGGE